MTQLFWLYSLHSSALLQTPPAGSEGSLGESRCQLSVAAAIVTVLRGNQIQLQLASRLPHLVRIMSIGAVGFAACVWQAAS